MAHRFSADSSSPSLRVIPEIPELIPYGQTCRDDRRIKCFPASGIVEQTGVGENICCLPINKTSRANRNRFLGSDRSLGQCVPDDATIESARSMSVSSRVFRRGNYQWFRSFAERCALRRLESLLHLARND